MGRGKKKLIKAPEEIIEMFNAYKKHTKSNPRYKYVLSQRTAEMVKEPLEVPLTMEGFEIFCYEEYDLTIDNYFKNTHGSYNDYYPVCQYVKKMIRQDQISGGMVGQYNPSITQRLNGLVEKSQVETDGKIEFVITKGKSIT